MCDFAGWEGDLVCHLILVSVLGVLFSQTPPSRHRDALHAHNPRYASLDRDYSHAGTSNAKVRSQQAAGVALAAAANPDTNGNAHLNPSSGKHDISRGTDARKSTFKRLFSNRYAD